MAFDVSSIFAEELKKVSKSDTGRRLLEVDIDDLTGNEANFYAVDADKLEELKNSIALSGIMDPPTVTDAGDGKYRLISGHRRTAAVRALVAEGREDLRKVPVFVRSPRSAAMEELELIMANSTARVLSSAEISEAAQRVERLLYELKEQGVAFPGRMRDHVAEACNVSKTKLANLKTIEEHLIVHFKAMWKSGRLPDATALELARCDCIFQTRLYAAFARTKDFPTSAGIERLRALAEGGAAWNPSACLRCPDGSACPAARGDAALRHDATCPSCEPKCKGEKCCMECEYGAKARGCYDVCEQMCSRAKQYRTGKNADAKEKEAKAEETRQRGFRAKIQQDAQRIIRAADAAGCGDALKLQLRGYAPAVPVGTVRSWASGDFGDAHFYGSDALYADSDRIPTVCQLLHCSADYLLGLTDELTPVSKSDTGNGWWSGTEYPDGWLACAWRQTSHAQNFKVMWAESKCLHFKPGGAEISFPPPDLWCPLPELPKEDGDAEAET